jgi:hypothetical protein
LYANFPRQAPPAQLFARPGSEKQILGLKYGLTSQAMGGKSQKGPVKLNLTP